MAYGCLYNYSLVMFMICITVVPIYIFDIDYTLIF